MIPNIHPAFENANGIPKIPAPMTVLVKLT
jgi:hypothetical protein